MEPSRNRTLKGFSLVELLVVIAVILIIITAAIPVMARIRMNSAETIVIREVQTIAQAQTQYQSQFGRYASTLAELGPTHGAADSPAAAGLFRPTYPLTPSGNSDQIVVGIGKRIARVETGIISGQIGP